MRRELYTSDGTSTKDEKNFQQVKYYFANSVELYQEELTYENFMKAVDIFKPKTSEALKTLTKFDFINLQLDRTEINKILNLLGLKDTEIKRMKASEVQVVIEDFFFLNPLLKEKLAAFANAHATKMMTDSLENLGLNAVRTLPGSLLHMKKRSTQSQGRTSKTTKKQRS